MIYLMYILGAIALLVILFLCIGLVIPSISYGSYITVNKPIDEAWAVMNDESRISEWLKDIQKTEHVSGEKGTVGAVTKYYASQGGRDSIIMETIKEIRHNECIAMDFTVEGAMDMDYRMDMKEKDGKTHITSSSVVKGVNFIMKSIIPLMKGAMQKQEDENLGNLQQLINGNTKDYSTSS